MYNKWKKIKYVTHQETLPLGYVLLTWNRHIQKESGGLNMLAGSETSNLHGTVVSQYKIRLNYTNYLKKSNSSEGYK